MAQFELARDDLEIAPRTIDGEVVYFVGDPIKLEFHRLDALQYEVFKKLDGKTSLEDLSAWLLQTHEVEAPPEALAEFVETLRGLNLLDISTDARIDLQRGRDIAAKVKQALAQDGVVFTLRKSSSPAPRGRERRARHAEAALFDAALTHLARGEVPACGRKLREVLEKRPDNARARYLLRLLFSETLGKPRDVDSILWWRIPFGNPDKFLGKIAASVGGLIYRRSTGVLAALVVLFGVGLLLTDIDRFIVDLKRFFEFRWVIEQPLIFLLIWTLGPPQLFLHEAAHGLTCRYYGGRVREMGVLIAYLQPTAYCDISSTYLLDSKWQRALTCFAGMIVDAVGWAGFVVLYHLTDSSSLIGLLALISVVVKAQGIFGSANPLVRSDGYFALTELVNYPNLNADARAFVKAKLLHLATGEEQELPDGAETHARLFWVYTLGSAAALSMILVPVLLGVSGYLVSRLQSVGVLLAAVLWYFVVVRHVLRFLRGVWNGRAVFRRSSRARKVLAATLLLLAAVAGYPARLTIDAPARVLPEIEWLRAPFTARVIDAVDQPAATVAAGEVVARLDTSALTLQVTSARVELQAAEMDLAALLAGARAEERGIAEAELGAAGRELAAASSRVAAARARARAGGGNEELDSAMAAQAAAQTRYVTAEKAVAIGRSGPTEESVAAARARIEGLRAELADAEARLAKAEVKSPVDGILVEADSPLRELAGRRVEVGSSIVGVRRAGGDRLELRVLAVEPISMLATGQEVSARLVGLPNERVVGRVIAIGSAVEKATGDQVIEGRTFLRVEASLPPEMQARGLPADLSGTVRIEGDRLPLVAHLWLRAKRLYDLDIRPLL